MSETYNIVIPQFEGPFDLLLFFIERDELDINDIPISKITKDFLDYIKDLQALNIDLASEFILVAATLMRIKTKLLLPRKQVDEEGNEIDPREELVTRLIEYKRFKSVIGELEAKESKRLKQEKRGNSEAELKKIAEKELVDVELESITLFKLMKTFNRLLEKMEDRNQRQYHRIYKYSYTIKSQQRFILEQTNQKSCSFADLFGNCVDRIHAVITFLALLELLNQHKVSIDLGVGFNSFSVITPLENDVLSEEE